MSKAVEFLKEAKAELEKVSWPTKEQIVRNTLIVIGISIATALFLGTLDYVFSRLAERFLFQ
ncbi:MAG: preprotein translocase subunit SecE [Candidatus Moranbacteria bacterium]|jgi:preprotein translocase subunit SecE|nr:preprotein translocase subunit SecE [Candidatus Moranbacteria bacterium]